MTNIQYLRSAIDAGGCVSNAWEMVKQNYGLYLGISLITILLTGCVPCLNLFLIGPVTGGVFYVVLRNMRGEPVEFGMMFKGFEKFVPLMVIGLIQAIPGIIAQTIQYGVRFAEIGMSGRNGDFDFFQSDRAGAALAGGMLVVILVVAFGVLIFSLVWWAVFFFAIPLAMEYDLGPVDAIKLSARAAMSNIGGMIVLLILEALVGLLGVLMCFLGIFLVSIPVIYVANAFAYRQVFPLMQQAMNNMMPPPPNVYGSSYGSGLT